MEVNSSSMSFTYYHCSNSTAGNLVTVAFVFIHIILLFPLSLLVLYLGHQRWRQQRSFATTSHSDIFTYHWAAMELIYVLGFACYCSGIHYRLSELMKVGFYATSNIFSGHISFHILTCVEHYLAIVYPVIYLRLRQSWGVRIRNISIGCVWVLYCGWIGVTYLYYPSLPYVAFFCFLAPSLVIVSFCSLSVLYVLIRPGPGGTGGKRDGTDLSKQKAFNTVTAIMAVMWLFFLGLLVSYSLERSHLLSYNDGCVVLACGYVGTLPSSLVLPLLFLNKAGKLVCCQSSSE